MRFLCCSVLQENFVKEFEWIISFLNSSVASHVREKPMSTDRPSVSKTIGQLKPAQLQAPHMPKNTSCCIWPCFQLGYTPGVMSWEYRTRIKCTQIISRAAKLLRFCPITPAHKKPPWPGYKQSLRLFTKLLVAHPLVGVCLLPDIRPVAHLKLTGYMIGSLYIRGHSAGSYSGMVWETILTEFPDIEGRTVLAAIALPPSLLTRPSRMDFSALAAKGFQRCQPIYETLTVK